MEGIPEEKEMDIFHPFYRLNNSVDERFLEHGFGSGMGVGLTLSQILLQKCSASLAIEEVQDNTRSVRIVRADIRIPLNK